MTEVSLWAIFRNIYHLFMRLTFFATLHLSALKQKLASTLSVISVYFAAFKIVSAGISMGSVFSLRVSGLSVVSVLFPQSQFYLEMMLSGSGVHHLVLQSFFHESCFCWPPACLIQAARSFIEKAFTILGVMQKMWPFFFFPIRLDLYFPWRMFFPLNIEPHVWVCWRESGQPVVSAFCSHEDTCLKPSTHVPKSA